MSVFWVTIVIALLVVTIPAVLFVCNGFNWNDDERAAEAERAFDRSSKGNERNGIVVPWPNDSVSAGDADQHRTSLGTDGGDPH
jgi:hypothetical protein